MRKGLNTRGKQPRLKSNGPNLENCKNFNLMITKIYAWGLLFFKEIVIDQFSNNIGRI